MKRFLALVALLAVAPVGAAGEPRNPDPGPAPPAEAAAGLDGTIWPPPGNPCRPTCARDTA